MLRHSILFFKNKIPEIGLVVAGNAKRRVNPDGPALITQQQSDEYVLRICIAANREFDLSAIDPRINHDKPWGKREWDDGAPTATSCEIPQIHKNEILASLRKNASVIFAEQSGDLIRVTQAPNRP